VRSRHLHPEGLRPVLSAGVLDLRQGASDAARVKDEPTTGQSDAKLVRPTRDEKAVRPEHALSQLGGRERVNDFWGGGEHCMPAPREIRRVGRLPREGEGSHFVCRVSCRPRGLLHDTERAESWILSTGRPGQVAERLNALARMDQIDPVANLQTTDEGQDFIRSQVKGVQGKAQIRMAYEGEETKRAVARPLHQHGLTALADLGLDEGRAFTDDHDRETPILEKMPIRRPARLQRLVGIVKEIDVARGTCS
jgi:hypothetical protein